MDEAELQLIEGELTRLNTAFYSHLDRGRYAEAAKLITRDAVVHWTGKDTHGREEFLAHLALYPANQTMRHLVCNQLFSEVTAGTARGESTLAVFLGPGRTDPSTPARASFAPHLSEAFDSYVRTAEGWQVVERTFRTLLLPFGG